MSTRTNTLFSLPNVSQYIRSNSVSTVIDNLDLDNQNDISKEKIECSTEKLNIKETYIKNKNVNFHELEVQLMMKDKMIEELLEENGKLIDNMNKLEQDKVDEKNRIQHGAEMILQQVVEDNEWYKAQFLEMKNELEKAILQTRNKGRELSTMEKRCKNLIEEKETIQNFLDELTIQYDERIEQIQFYKNRINKMKDLINKFIGNQISCKFNNLSNSYCSLNEIIYKIKQIINDEIDISKIDDLIKKIESNTKDFEIEINEILNQIHDKNNKNILCIENNLNNNIKEENNIDIKLNNDYEKINQELENAKSEIKKLNYEIERKAEIINELRTSNNNKLEILDEINNNEENFKIKILKEKVDILEDEKKELIRKIANLNRIYLLDNNNNNKIHVDNNNMHVNNGINNLSKNFNNVQNNDNNKFTLINEKNILNSNLINKEEEEKNSFNNIKNEYNKEDPISNIIDRYIKYPVDYGEKRQNIQKKSFERNKYF